MPAHITPPQASRTEILGKAETVKAVSELIDSATKRLTLISPYSRLGKLRDLGRRLLHALRRGVKVSLVVRAPGAGTGAWDAGDVEEVQRLLGAGLKLFMVADLHAKAYFNESSALVTSLNLVENSFNNSIELGVRFHHSEPEYDDLMQRLGTEVRDAMQAVESLDELTGGKPAAAKPATSRPSRAPSETKRPRREKERNGEPSGVCFRCGRPGHWVEDCYARTTVDGERIDDDNDDDW